MSDKTLYENPFMAIIDRDGYVFMRSTRTKATVSLLPFRRTSQGIDYLARVEICPAHKPQHERCSITGGVKHDEEAIAAAVRELYEEAGYRVNANDLIALDLVRPSKQSDTIVYLYAVDVSNMQQVAAPGDGTKLEASAWVEWVDEAAGLKIEDPLFIAALARLRRHLAS